MLRASFLALTLLATLGAHMAAAAEADSGANAALKYWQAFAQLPTFTNDEQAKLHDGCLTMPLDAKARELVSKGDYALRMLHRGAGLPHCDWGLGFEDGIEVLLPHLPAARTIAALACLRARLRFEEGKDREAMDDLLDALILARHASRDGSLIAVLVGYSIEQRAAEAIARYLPQLSAEQVKELKARLDALPPSATPTEALLSCEQSTMEWLQRQVKEAKDEASLLTFLNALCGLRGDSVEKQDAEGQAFLQECGGREGVLKFADETRQSYLRMAKVFELPPSEFEAQYQREAERQAGNPVFKLLFPALVKARQAQARSDVRRALLLAAVAVQLDGREALPLHPDPVIGGPFEMLPHNHGFELRSKLPGSDNKPLSLTVGAKSR